MSDLMEIQVPHRLFVDLMNGNLISSAFQQESSPGTRVLDLGTGDGDWAVDFSKRYPQSNVVAIDVNSPPSALDRCRFERVDFNSPWPRWPVPFHLIHGRMLSSSISDLGQFFAQAHHTLYPGGIIEMQDVRLVPEMVAATLSDNVNAQTLRLIAVMMRQVAEHNEMDWDRPRQYRSALQDRGFVDIEERRETWPIGPWSNDRDLKLFSFHALEHATSIFKRASDHVLARFENAQIRPQKPRNAGYCVRSDDFSRNVRNALKDCSLEAYFEL